MKFRRGVVLLLVLVCVALAAALVTPLATMSGGEAMTAAYQADTLRHRLVGDSLLATLPAWLTRNPDLTRQLNRAGSVTLALPFADIDVRARLTEDSAKLPLSLLPADPESRTRILTGLAASAGLALPHLASKHQSPRCVDDLFESATDRELFGTLDEAGWAHVLTSFGSRVNVRHASAPVLDAALSDIKRGMGAELVRRRNLDPTTTVEQLVGSLELTSAQRRSALERLDTRVLHYSLLLETTIDGVRRCRYVIVSAEPPQRVLSDWEVSP